MKKVLLLGMATVMLLCSFSLKNLFGGSKSSTPTTTTPTETTINTNTNNDGMAAGKALRGIYTQYKADGKFDAGNINNILNTISLINSCKNLKENAKGGDYWTSFAAGLVLGSEQLVVPDVSSTVTDKLGEMIENVDTSKLESTVEKAQAVNTAANDIMSIISLFK